MKVLNIIFIILFAISAGLQYNDAIFSSINVSQSNSEVNLKGKRQLFTPDFSSILALQFEGPVKSQKGFGLLLRAEWKYLGEQYFDFANTIQQEPYSLFNSSIGFSIKNPALTFWARNLNDERYIDYAYDFGAVHLGNPQLFGTTLRLGLNR